mmetsp:Transcript_25472/g.53039  ORF Transcript_25472/g.53039 Transcript_25472/m.53039 type:complete len:264 (+) Transcript_25472:1103-1894(+)
MDIIPFMLQLTFGGVDVDGEAFAIPMGLKIGLTAAAPPIAPLIITPLIIIPPDCACACCCRCCCWWRTASLSFCAVSSPAFCAALSCSSRELISLACFLVTWLRRCRWAMVRAIKSTRLVGEKGGRIIREATPTAAALGGPCLSVPVAVLPEALPAVPPTATATAPFVPTPTATPTPTAPPATCSRASSRAARSCCNFCSSASMRLRTSVSSPNCLLTSVRRCFSRLRFRSERAWLLHPSSISLLVLAVAETAPWAVLVVLLL